MSNNNQDSELDDNFIIRYIKMVIDLYQGEKFLNEKILNNKIQKKK